MLLGFALVLEADGALVHLVLVDAVLATETSGVICKQERALFTHQPQEQQARCEPQRSGRTDVYHPIQKTNQGGFPGGSVVKNLPAIVGDMGSIPGPGRFHT